MTGFELKFRDRVLSLPSEAMVTITMVRRRPGTQDITVHAGLYDPATQNSVGWLDSDMASGDEVHIEIKNVGDITEPSDVHNFYERIGTTKEESDKRALERFISLKKELEEENLI